MNKKFSTLMALALLAGSFPVAAQFCTVNGEVPYHTRFVKAAALDANISGVKKINQEYYYQLAVKPASLGEKDGTYVLVAERDYSTGKIYLTAQEITKATLTHSLWQIKVTERSANGRVYTYVNKETGFELAFDHTNALQRVGGRFVIPSKSDKDAANDKYKENAANYGWTYENKGLTDGCIDHWAWYTTEDNGVKELPWKRVYSYFHNKVDSVMTLHAVRTTDTFKNEVYDNNPGLPLAENDFSVKGLSVAGLDGSKTGGWAIVAVKDSEANARDFIGGMTSTGILEICPVVAGAKVLNADEINSMIDADGSFLTFGEKNSKYIKWYNEWKDAANGDRAGKFAKFTVLNPETGEELNVVEGANPFAHAFKDGKFEAETVYGGEKGVLRRDNFNSNNKTDFSKANAFAGYDILLKTKEPMRQVGNQKEYGYLYVSEHNYEGTPTANYNGLEVKIQPYAAIVKKEKAVYLNAKEAIEKSKHTAPDALEARYHWKATYYATNDSLVLEPLNASRMNTNDMKERVPFEKTHLAGHSQNRWVNTVNAATAYGTSGAGSDNVNATWMSDKKAGVPVALYAMNNSQVGDTDYLLTVGTPSNAEAFVGDYAALPKTNGNPAYVTNKVVEKVSPYQADMELRLKFDHDYTHLTRATMASGVYFMNLSTTKTSTAQTEHRVNGANVVADMGGHVVYDVEEQGQQDFNHMPATQWVVEQQPCLEGDDVNANENPTVRIYNREYADQLFGGQLYTAGDGKFFTIDHRHYGWLATQQNVDRHYRKTYNCADTVTFAPVEVNELGYFNETDENLRNTTYMFQHMYDMNAGKFLTVSDKNNNVRVGDTGTSFELFRSEGWVPVPDSTESIVNGEIVKDFAGTYHFAYVKEQKYGYASEAANATQLVKTFYKIKVKDANLIDNDHKFVAINNQHKYVVATEDEINDPKNHLSFAIVSLKENNHLNDIHGYAIVNNPTYIKVNAKTDADLKGLKYDSLRDEFGYSYDIYYKDNDDKSDDFNPEKDVIMVEMARSNNQVKGKLGVEAVSLDTKIDNLCATSTDAFALVQEDRPLYRDLSAEYADLINNEKKVINIIGVDEQSNEFLFEDSNSKPGMNYLGIENKTDLTSNEGFYVDKVAKSTKVMPQYLFAVAADSVPAYTYCNCDIDGHSQHGINAGCGHAETYPGYVEGRFLINFNDSINKALIDKETNADKYKSSVYTRLGFVEAIHRGDYLYVLTNGRTLESLKMEAKDGSGMKYICPDSLAKDQEGKIYTLVELNGKHNNAAFSLRNTGDADNTFMLESNDTPTGVKGYSQVGSFAGAWVKVINGVPVLAKYWNDNGNHNTGDTTDSWFEMGDYTDASDVTGEFINQGARFTFEAIEKDANATANEEIAASSVVVAGTNGAVVVKGAEGKNVIVSTILGKVVANEVLTSDNAQIAAPQGVVVVSVDGESFKVVVK